MTRRLRRPRGGQASSQSPPRRRSRIWKDLLQGTAQFAYVDVDWAEWASTHPASSAPRFAPLVNEARDQSDSVIDLVRAELAQIEPEQRGEHIVGVVRARRRDSSHSLRTHRHRRSIVGHGHRLVDGRGIAGCGQGDAGRRHFSHGAHEGTNGRVARSRFAQAFKLKATDRSGYQICTY